MKAWKIFTAIKGASALRRYEVGMPRFLTYIVTFNCNARCIMCDSWKKPSPDDLTLGEVDRVFRQLPEMDVVRLSGGEPFARLDLLHIAHLAQEHLKPLQLHVTTNGFLTDRIIRFCEERRRDVPLQLLVSVDGLEAKHNAVRGRETAWSSVTATLEALAGRRRELNLALAVNQTIVDAEGARDYKPLNAYLAERGIRHHVVMAYDVSATYNLADEIDAAPKAPGDFTTFGAFQKSEISRLWREVEADVAGWPLLERVAKSYYIKGIRNRVLHGEGDPNPPCVALNAHLRMLPNGDVPTCQFNTGRVGNLRRQSFEEVWFGDRIRRQRAWVKRCAGCWAECEVLPSAIYTGDLWRGWLEKVKRPKQSEESLGYPEQNQNPA